VKLRTVVYCLRFETPPTWRARSPYLFTPGTGWYSYIPRHWVPFTSPPTTRRATVEIFEPASTRVLPSRGFLRIGKALVSNFGLETIMNNFSWSYSVSSRLATGWMIEGSEFESRQSQKFSFLHVVQTGSGVHPASYPMGTGGSFPGDKAIGERS
jgi:hypothetical protein